MDMKPLVFSLLHALIPSLSTLISAQADANLLYICTAILEPLLGNIYITPPHLKPLEKSIMNADRNGTVEILIKALGCIKSFNNATKLQKKEQ